MDREEFQQQYAGKFVNIIGLDGSKSLIYIGKVVLEPTRILLGIHLTQRKDFDEVHILALPISEVGQVITDKFELLDDIEQATLRGVYEV